MISCNACFARGQTFLKSRSLFGWTVTGRRVGSDAGTARKSLVSGYRSAERAAIYLQQSVGRCYGSSGV